MKVVSFSEARNNLKTVFDEVVENADYTIVTRRDAENVVVMSLDSFNSSKRFTCSNLPLMPLICKDRSLNFAKVRQ
jgi:prevent-host-death family protein